jgi:hypothetical protein
MERTRGWRGPEDVEDKGINIKYIKRKKGNRRG